MTRSYLGKFVASGPTSDEDMAKMRKKAWQDYKIFVVALDDVVNPFDRQNILNMAAKFYEEKGE